MFALFEIHFFRSIKKHIKQKIETPLYIIHIGLIIYEVGVVGYEGFVGEGTAFRVKWGGS